VTESDTLSRLRAALSGRYEVERELGAGGMAVVFLARDLQHDRAVALKVLREELGAGLATERFHREIRLAAQLVHPNILPLLDSGEADGRLWYAMPYVAGETLRTRLAREGTLPIDEAIRLTREIAGALTHAHAKGILHRDIKPENILLADGHALVADFGIARALHGDGSDRITDTGLTLGTPAYMSPEQSSGEKQLDPRSDLYALASVCYEMLVGEPPFTGPSAQAIIARRLSQPPPSLRTTRQTISESLDAAVRRGLALHPADRFPGTAEFVRALDDAVGGSISAAPARRRPVLIAATLVLAAALAYPLLERAPPTASATPDEAGIRLAVVPFRLIGGDSADRYLAAGITEEVQSDLSNLNGLRVIAQSSVASYATEGRSARELGAALRAEALVEGDVQRAGDAVRVRVRLIDPATEELKWSQQYDHTTRDVFLIQSEVASRIAGVLRIQLAERESRSLRRPPTTNPDAYDIYLRVRSRGLPTRMGRGLDSAIVQMRRAVALDSSFALAKATLATYLISSVFLFNASPEHLDEAERHIREALATDSTLAIAWKARHDLVWNAVRGWHFEQALSYARHAIALQPSLYEARSALGSLLFHYGFHEEARQELEASLSLNPADGCDDPTRCVGFSRPRVARVLWYQQKFDSALAIHEGFASSEGFLWEKAIILNALGRSTEALARLDSTRLDRYRVERVDERAARALIFATLGRREEALAQIASVVARPGGGSHFHHAQVTLAFAYARLGQKADAVEWLQRASENGMPNYPLFRNDPHLRSLQGDPGYESLMARLQKQHEAYRRLVQGEP
jgi:TolB-like protein/tetratricopeptide (TPR) repeat protein